MNLQFSIKKKKVRNNHLLLYKTNYNTHFRIIINNNKIKNKTKTVILAQISNKISINNIYNKYKQIINLLACSKIVILICLQVKLAL